MNKESKLESLRLLFSPGLDDNDLLSILEEAQDDLDLAIARISEGQTATWELRKPKMKNTFRGRGRGSHRSHAQSHHRQREAAQKDSSSNFTPKEKDLKDNFAKGKVKERVITPKAGLVGTVEQKSFNQKKKKSFEKKDKTSWAQLVKGQEEEQMEENVIAVITAKKEEKKVLNSKNSLVVKLSKQVQKEEFNENNNLPPGLLSGNQGANVKKTVSKQQEAVVMPQNSNLSSMGVQFGSLKVSKEEKNLAEKVAVLDSKRIKTPLKTEAAPQNSNVPSGMNMMQYPSMTPMNYFQQVPGFGMMPSNGEFQQLYGADGVQGYYSSPYAKFPAGSQSTQPTSTAGTSQTTAVSSQNPQQMALHQQQFAMPFGYYPYYMPSQYQNAPGAHPSYGAQYVNKNVYHYGPSVSGAPVGTSSLTTSALPASNTQSSSRNNNAPGTAAVYPFVSAAPLYGNYDESLGISGATNATNGNIPFHSGFANQSSNAQGQTNAANARGSASGSNSSGHNFSNQRPAYDKFSNSVSAPSTNESYYNPDQPSFANQYQHQQHQHHQQHQQYYMQHQQPQQVVYGAYNNGRNTQQNLQYWTATSNGGQ